MAVRRSLTNGVGRLAWLRCPEDRWQRRLQEQVVVVVAGQEALHQEGPLELGALVEREKLGLGQAVVASEAQMVREQVGVQGSLAESVAVVGAAAVAVPEGEVFDSVTVRQYTAKFHRTLSEHSLQPSESKELPCHQLLSSTQADFDQSQFHVLQCMA